MASGLDRNAQRDPEMTNADAQKQQTVPRTEPPTHDAVDLTRGGNQAWIEHSGQIYVLRITRAGKLILTK
jgi:hemin uptake protein HemP